MLEEMGFRVKPGEHLRSAWGYLAGKDEERIADLNAAFADPEVDAVFCAGGGYGTPRILDKLDYEAIRKHPKVFAGYSDITGLHMAIRAKVGMVTFHAPMVCRRKPNQFARKAMLAAMTRPEPMGLMASSRRHERRALSPGTAEGPLVGGNLSLLVSVLGTPYDFDATGCILFIEDVGEKPYRLDRMFTQLRLAGKFEQAAGIALGHFTGCDPEEGRPSQTVGEILQDYFGRMAKPVISGLPFGHEADNWTLPIGARAALNAEALTLEVTEAAVV